LKGLVCQRVLRKFSYKYHWTGTTQSEMIALEMRSKR